MGPISKHKCEKKGKKHQQTRQLQLALNDARVCNWRLSDGFVFSQFEERLYISREDQKPFSQFSVNVENRETTKLNDYQSITPFMTKGGVLYTGFFQPYKNNDADRRLKVRFSFLPMADYFFYGHGGNGDMESAFSGTWQSPENHPAFVYMGPELARHFDNTNLIMDAALPSWLREEFMSLIPSGEVLLSRAFEHKFERPPAIFIAAADMEKKDGVSFRGLAVPGGVLIRLSGSGWREKDPQTLSLIREGILHEMVHLWQSRLRPNDLVPDWLHEGSVEAMTGEAMVALGYWSETEFLADHQKAALSCESEISGSSLELRARENPRISYACGQMIARLTAMGSSYGKQSRPVLAMWRDYIEARIEAGYSQQSWFGFTKAHETAPGLSAAIERFVKTRALVHGPQIRNMESLAAENN